MGEGAGRKKKKKKKKKDKDRLDLTGTDDAPQNGAAQPPVFKRQMDDGVYDKRMAARKNRFKDMEISQDGNWAGGMNYADLHEEAAGSTGRRGARSKDRRSRRRSRSSSRSRRRR